MEDQHRREIAADAILNHSPRIRGNENCEAVVIWAQNQGERRNKEAFEQHVICNASGLWTCSIEMMMR